MNQIEKAQTEVLEFYRRESTGPGPIWSGAAKQIVEIVETLPVESAIARLRQIRRSCRQMAVSSFYQGAANTLARGLRSSKRSTKPDKAPQNDCDGSGPHLSGEVRLLPTGGGANAILCRNCFNHELDYRRERILDGVAFELPTWESLKVYGE